MKTRLHKFKKDGFSHYKFNRYPHVLLHVLDSAHQENSTRCQIWCPFKFYRTENLNVYLIMMLNDMKFMYQENLKIISGSEFAGIHIHFLSKTGQLLNFQTTGSQRKQHG